jgi:hypothetical protein
MKVCSEIAQEKEIDFDMGHSFLIGAFIKNAIVQITKASGEEAAHEWLVDTMRIVSETVSRTENGVDLKIQVKTKEGG